MRLSPLSFRGKRSEWRSPPVYRDFRPPITGESKGVGTSFAGEGVRKRVRYVHPCGEEDYLFSAPPHR